MGSSVQFSRLVVSDSSRLHESQHARPPCGVIELSYFSFLSNCQTVFHSACPILHSHPQYMTVLSAEELMLLNCGVGEDF